MLTVSDQSCHYTQGKGMSCFDQSQQSSHHPSRRCEAKTEIQYTAGFKLIAM